MTKKTGNEVATSNKTMEGKTMSNLEARIKAKTQNTKPAFLEGREKGDYEDLLDQVVTLRNFGIGNHSTLGDFVSFVIDEDTTHYYNQGGIVVVDSFKKIVDDLPEIQETGIPIMITKVKGKNRRVYTKVEFFPEV